MEPVKLQVRAGVSFVLGFLPTQAIMQLRQLHRSSKPRSIQRRVYSSMLNVLRHRHLDPEVETIRIDELDLSLWNDNSIITKRLFYLGQYEGRETLWWKSFCREAEDIVEFGANTGLYTIVGARAPNVVRYTAIEPHPRCVEVLRRNLQINQVANVTVVEAAVVGKEGTTEMELCVPFLDADPTPTGGSLVLGELSDRPPRDRIMVRTVVARPFFEHAELVKMDIEGQELSVLESVQDLLARRKPTIFLEVLPENLPLRNYLPALCQSCGYKVYAITENGLQQFAPTEVPRLDHYDLFGTRDLILTASMVLPSAPAERL